MKLRGIKIFSSKDAGHAKSLSPEYFAKLTMFHYIYLSSPYSHSNKKVMEKRARQIQAIDVDLMRAGIITYCPIGSCHDKALHHALPTDHEYWLRMNRIFIQRSNGMIIATLPGWDESRGVAEEIRLCKEFYIPYYFLQATFDD